MTGQLDSECRDKDVDLHYTGTLGLDILHGGRMLSRKILESMRPQKQEFGKENEKGGPRHGKAHMNAQDAGYQQLIDTI